MNTKRRPLTEVGCDPYSDGYWSRHEGLPRTPPERAPRPGAWREGWDVCDSETKSEEAEDAVRSPAAEAGKAPELLAKLRAAGVEPLTDEDLLAMSAPFVAYYKPGRLSMVRLAADLLEARGQLAEVREQLANADAAFADVRKLAIAATGKVLRVSEWAERVVAEESPPRGIVAAERGGCASEVLEILDREPTP